MTATSPERALTTVVDRVETSPAIALLDQRATSLVELLPDAQAAARFRRVVIQALAKNPDLLECTPESVVLSVFEAAQQGLEPTGAAGGAHLVPYKVNVGTRQSPRYEKRAQLIPDYRGVIRLVTKPPSDVVSLEARVVKEGDDFSYELGTEAAVHHIPNLLPGRSEKATTHVYAIARLKNGSSIPDVEDRAGIERIQKRGRGSAFSPWATDWDEMAKKTIIKRIAKVLPVRPEIRSILVREDEFGGPDEPEERPEPASRGRSRASRLAARLGTADHPASQPTAPQEPPSEIERTEAAATHELSSIGFLTSEELREALARAEISIPFAQERAKTLFPDAAGRLSDAQRAQLLEDLTSDELAAAGL
ncbi:MAG: recombinase RecT [Chloroflexota bacterium]